MSVTAHRLPIAELQRRAVKELAANPTITTYQWINDRYIATNLNAVLQRNIDYVLGMICDLIGIDRKTLT
mgnify:FL=1